MKISDRFTDYGLIRGLFWALQSVIWFVWHDQSLSQAFASFIGHFDKITGSAATLVAALGVIVVFATGLFLNVAGVLIFRRNETYVFRDNLNQNMQWLKPFMHANSIYVREDARLLVAPLEYEQKRIIGRGNRKSEDQDDRTGIFWYRHVNQAERWRSVPMQQQSGGYHGAIPADYTNSAFPLQYYFELRSSKAAWFHPAFNATLSNQPYYDVAHRSA